MPQEEDFIRPAGAARRAGVSQGTIRRWLDDPDVPVRKYQDAQKRVWIKVSELDAFNVRRNTPVPVTGSGR